jgi:hypothetical protein
LSCDLSEEVPHSLTVEGLFFTQQKHEISHEISFNQHKFNNFEPEIDSIGLSDFDFSFGKFVNFTLFRSFRSLCWVVCHKIKMAITFD